MVAKIYKAKTFLTNGSLMKVKCIAECSNFQYFRPALGDNLSCKPISGILRVHVLHRFTVYKRSDDDLLLGIKRYFFSIMLYFTATNSAPTLHKVDTVS